MPGFVRWFYPTRVWAFSRLKKEIYLTFDDGPNNQITPWVLEELKSAHAKATFFCVGDNIRKNPHILKQILSEGHSIGNHTFNHLKGSRTKTEKYIENVQKSEEEFKKYCSEKELIDNSFGSKLFRPPYGRISKKQAGILEKQGYKIVMWDIISYDYDAGISGEKCLDNVISNVKNGSIIVMHDSVKAEKNLRYVLPNLLNILTEKGFQFSRM